MMHNAKIEELKDFAKDLKKRDDILRGDEK